MTHITYTPAQMTEAREWLTDATSLNERKMTDEQILKTVDRYVDGGWNGFLLAIA